VAEFAAGQHTTSAVLNRRGFSKYGRRDSVSSTSSSSTAVGALRVDSIAVVSGRAYIIHISSHPNSTVAGDILRGEVRGVVGSTATASSPVLPSGQFVVTIGNPQAWSFVYIAASTGNLSIALCCARFSGTGAVSYYADGTRNTELWVEDMNPITDTGTDM
jgi:hypothetical protein